MSAVAAASGQSTFMKMLPLDCCWKQDSMKGLHLVSGLVPQDLSLNLGIWPYFVKRSRIMTFL